MIRPAREHRVHGGCGLGEGRGVCRVLVQRRRADRVHFRSSGGRLGAALEVDLVELSRQASTGMDGRAATCDHPGGEVPCIPWTTRCSGTESQSSR